MNIVNYHSPVGLLEITGDNGVIISVRLMDKLQEPDSPDTITLEAKKQLEEYFSGKRFVFNLPLKLKGTPFQQKVWEYLSTIPYGETVSYKEEATAIGNPKACRAVGSANGANNFPIVIPCHRVIASDKKLGGYAYGLLVKEKLLQLEKKFSENTDL